MIARLAIPIILTVLLTNVYFDRVRWRRLVLWRRLLCWLPPVTTVAVTIVMADTPYYFPDQIYKLELYLALVAVYIAPMALVALCSLLGRCVRRPATGRLVGWAMALLVAAVYVYGNTVGFGRLEVTRMEIACKDLPKAFDGYKIVQFSDAHVGTYTGWRQSILKRAVDSINAQQADMVVFTGDLQNKEPSELVEHMPLLSAIKAKDGVFSVLGNHDYTTYLGTDDPFVVSRNMGMIEGMQTDMGWTLLLNDHRYINRDSSRIVIAGMENDGEGRFPQLGNINATLYGVSLNDFVIMLEHDPTSWRRKILPHSHTQLTLSGHTHAAQFSICGWSPAALQYREYEGLYQLGDRALYVSKGLGGVVPFRFGASGEIVVITLRCK